MVLKPSVTISQAATLLRTWSIAAQTLPPWVQRRLGGLSHVNSLAHDLDALATALKDMPAVETPRLCDYCNRPTLPNDIFCAQHRAEENARFAADDLARVLDN